ncbi:MAG: hypothetical protein HYZ63_04135 [Candidatus Andersenbacteria bacterium]|nr:hypothetical protein [Candidatus Andersenbacteria bacterium]
MHKFFLSLLGVLTAFICLSPLSAQAAAYPSPAGKDWLPNGFLVKSVAGGDTYYVKNGTKSKVLPRIIELWLKEAHYLKTDLIVKLPGAELGKYKEVSAVNPLYIGKILQAPDGKQYFIDNLLRRRPISAAVRKALVYPSRNVYPTTASHIAQFKLGPAITRTDVHPGGTVIYFGPYHGGTVWRIEEDAKGNLTKRFYLQDYIYETEGYPWSSQILPVSAEELARYPRGLNIATYPDGWVVGLSGNNYLVQNGTLRLLPEAIRKAMGYNIKYVLTVFPEFLKRYPRGEAVTQFKTVTAKVDPALAKAAAAPNVASTYTKVRPAIRALIADVNNIYLVMYGHEATAAENQFWVNYLYSGEATTRAALEAAMKSAKASGKKPALTSRTAELSADTMKSKWFPYLFYFVHQSEPSDADKDYWYGRIDGGSRSIEGLGGTMQYIKDTTGGTRK